MPSKGRHPVSRFLYGVINPVITYIEKNVKVSPDLITGIGLLISMPSAYFYAVGKTAVGSIILTIASIFDVMDGRIAERQGKMSRFGSFLDSTVDRFVELFIFIGFTYLYINEGRLIFSYISIIYITGSFLTSYTRAKIESLGEKGGVGFVQRFERIFIIIMTGFFGKEALFWGIVVVSLASYITVFYRIYYAKKVLKD